MGINWGFTEEQAKIKAKAYASKYTNPGVEAAAINAYFQGYMENAAERESLRVINERLEKERLNTAVVRNVPVIQDGEVVTHATVTLLGSFM